MNARDTQFAGFAKLLAAEINEAWNSEALDCLRDGLDVTHEKECLLITRRAYDLVCHSVDQLNKLRAIEHSYRDEVGVTPQAMIRLIPDLDVWPEDKKQ